MAWLDDYLAGLREQYPGYVILMRQSNRYCVYDQDADVMHTLLNWDVAPLNGHRKAGGSVSDNTKNALKVNGCAYKIIQDETVVETYDPPVQQSKQFVIKNVTLLSEEEYKKSKGNIPLNSSGQWWLRSEGIYQISVACVRRDGSLYTSRVSNVIASVRPALICDLSSSGLSVGNKISLAGYQWTVISDSIILCDEFVGRTAFRKGAFGVNDYDTSDIKAWLANWVATHPF